MRIAVLSRDVTFTTLSCPKYELKVCLCDYEMVVVFFFACVKCLCVD